MSILLLFLEKAGFGEGEEGRLDPFFCMSSMDFGPDAGRGTDGKQTVLAADRAHSM